MPSSEHTSPNRARLQRVLSTSLLRRRSRTSTASETSHPPLLTASSPPTVAPGRVRRLFTRLLLGRRRATAMRTAIVGCEVPLPLRQLAATSGQRTASPPHRPAAAEDTATDTSTPRAGSSISPEPAATNPTHPNAPALRPAAARQQSIRWAASPERSEEEVDLATNDLPPISPLPSPESPIIDDDGSLYPGDLSLSGTAIIEAERDDGEQEEQDASLMNQGAANAVVEDEPAVLDARRLESTSTSAHARVDSREAAPVQPSRTLSSLEFFQFDLGFVRPAPVNEDDAWTTTDEGTPESGLNIIEVPRPRLSFPAGPALRTPSALLGPITTEAIGETNDTGVRNRSGRIPYVVIWEDVMDPSVDAARLPLRSELEEASYAFPRLAQPAPATTPTQSASAPSPTQPVAVGTVAPVYPHSEITWPAEASSPAPEASSISAAPEPSPATASPAIEAAASAESVQAQVEAGIIDDATLSWLFSRIRRAAQENDGDYEELVSARLRELLRRGAAMTTSPVPVASDEAVQDQLEDGVINDATLEFLYAQIRAVALASNGDYTQLVSARLRLLEDRGTRLVRRNAVTDD